MTKDESQRDQRERTPEHEALGDQMVENIRLAIEKRKQESQPNKPNLSHDDKMNEIMRVGSENLSQAAREYALWVYDQPEAHWSAWDPDGSYRTILPKDHPQWRPEA
jgi:hypothetical protein